MKRTHTFTALCLAGASVFAIASPATAQDVSRDPTPTYFDLDFKGGTLEEYVAAIRDAFSRANVVVNPDAAGMPLPAVQLKWVDLGAALELLNYSVARESGWAVTASKINVAKKGDDLYVISGGRSDAAPRKASKRQAEVFGIRETLESGVSEEDLLAGVEAALGVFEGGEAAVKFHPPTGLLFVYGTEEQLGLVGNALAHMSTDASRGSRAVFQVEAELEDIELQIIRAEAEYTVTQQQHQVYDERLDRLRERFKSGAISSKEVEDLELTVHQLRADLRVAEAELDKLVQQRRRFTDHLAKLRKQLF